MSPLLTPMLPLHHHQTTTAERVAAVEAQIESERRQHEVVPVSLPRVAGLCLQVRFAHCPMLQTTRKRFEDATDHWKAQEHDYEQRLATEKKRLQEATIVAEAANDTIAALRHDMASLRRREDGAVTPLLAPSAVAATSHCVWPTPYACGTHRSGVRRGCSECSMGEEVGRP